MWKYGLTSKAIKDFRVKHRLTQHQLAGLVNTTNNSVSAWEKGRNVPQPMIQKRLGTLISTEMPPNATVTALQLALEMAEALQAKKEA